jgi:hypothetical protein
MYDILQHSAHGLPTALHVCGGWWDTVRVLLRVRQRLQPGARKECIPRVRHALRGGFTLACGRGDRVQVYTRSPPPTPALPYGWRVVSACSVDNASRVLEGDRLFSLSTTRPRFVRLCARVLPILKMGRTSSIPGPVLRMGMSAIAGRVGRAGSYLPARLRMIVRRPARKTRRILMGVVGLGGFRYSPMSIEHQKYRRSGGRRRGLWSHL